MKNEVPINEKILSVLDESTDIIDHNQIMVMLGIKRTTLFKLLHTGNLPVVKLGKKYITTKQQLYNWIKENEGQKVL